MSGFVSLLVASGGLRVASLNLCTDEYLLLLARPEEIASVSFLAHDPLESRLWQQARRYPANSGSLEGTLRDRPKIVLTMGGTGRATTLIARRLGIRAVTLPLPSSIGDVERNLVTVAELLGDRARAAPMVARIQALRTSAPDKSEDAIWIGGGGLSLAAGSPGVQWLELAGFRQRNLPGGQVDLETILINPPKYLVKSEYRSGQMSRGKRWLDHPIVRKSSAKRVAADGRVWTCAGPLMIGEVARLRDARR